MAKARAIVKRLKAIRNIRKITRTMELIATARFKKAMDRAVQASAYTRKMAEIVADLAEADLQLTHPLLQQRSSVQRVLLLVITSNRGLCGGYNAGVLRVATERIRQLQTDGRELYLEVAGKRGLNYLRFQKQQIDEEYTHFEDKVRFEEVDVLATRYIDWYGSGRVDRVEVAYTQFESSSRQRPVVETLLPIGRLHEADTPQVETGASGGGYEFLPSAAEILEEIVPASFKARLFKCFLDAAVSEQIARMVAMKAATENAGEMIHTLTLRYNRARQTQITSEISEIIGGAAALE
ncbi:MAG TPA: ATP synthase F1 subunit gamma [Planctomycetaceae bacterium]|nr:ATP synthase F1 subunit gamma [Planctomycetaceae bacterium]